MGMVTNRSPEVLEQVAVIAQLDHRGRIHEPAIAALGPVLAAEGFRPSAPDHVTSWTLGIDAQIAATSRCERCRQRGLILMPWHNDRGVYWALARCCRCNHEVEM
jgi:hypothetical protein